MAIPSYFGEYFNYWFAEWWGPFTDILPPPIPDPPGDDPVATAIDISSNALILIGDNPISSFDDPGAGAQAAANLYPETYKSFISTYPWSFALKEQKLNRLTSQPDELTGFKYAYQIPTDLIRLWAILPHSEYRIVGNLLYSNETELLGRYGFKVSETKLPPHFVKALEYKLASDFALLITESKGKSDTFEAKFREAAARARSVDSQQQPQEAIMDRPFTDARRGGFGSGSGFFG